MELVKPVKAQCVKVAEVCIPSNAGQFTTVLEGFNNYFNCELRNKTKYS